VKKVAANHVKERHIHKSNFGSIAFLSVQIRVSGSIATHSLTVYVCSPVSGIPGSVACQSITWPPPTGQSPTFSQPFPFRVIEDSLPDLGHPSPSKRTLEKSSLSAESVHFEHAQNSPHCMPIGEIMGHLSKPTRPGDQISIIFLACHIYKINDMLSLIFLFCCRFLL
jgi:hypothetical protein